MLKNSQRKFKRESLGTDNSTFHSQGSKSKGKNQEEEEGNEDLRRKIWLSFSSPMGYHRQILVTEDSETTYGFDLGYDAPLNDNLKEDVYWMLAEVPMVIQGVPHFYKEKDIPLGIKTKEEGNFTVSIDSLLNIPDDFAILIRDYEKETSHDLRESPFSFQATEGTINDRFALAFENEMKKPEGDEIEEEKPININMFYSGIDSEIKISNPDYIPVKKATLYNLNGQLLQNYLHLNTQAELLVPVSLDASGIYIFKLETEEGIKSLKFIIN